MEDLDPMNVTYSQIIHGMDPEELEAIAHRAFVLEVAAVAKELTDMADDLSTHFDPYVVAAALAVVLDDYERHTDERIDDE